MKKILKLIVIELLITAALMPVGLAVDMYVADQFNADTPHWVPFFYTVFPICGIILMIAIDIIIAVVCLIKAAIRKSKK